MRRIQKGDIIKSVKDALIHMNTNINPSLEALLRKSKENESSTLARHVLEDILDNADIASKNNRPLCQDTGMVVVFADIGQDTIIEGNLIEHINQAVKEAFSDAFLRKSIVKGPFKRVNTTTNTPAVIHMNIVPGEKLTLHVMSKGAGSENKSALKMLTPTDGLNGVKEFVIKTIKDAGGQPCPPIIVGVGLGGTMEQSALLAKRVLLRPLDSHHYSKDLKELEISLLKEINALGIGPMGVGGQTTCLAVLIDDFPMHIASLPVAVNIQCHSARHETVII
jgi:fumarate hydratase subunit alpha